MDCIRVLTRGLILAVGVRQGEVRYPRRLQITSKEDFVSLAVIEIAQGSVSEVWLGWLLFRYHI